MKKKLLILLISTALLTFIIFKFNYHNKILITSINSLDEKNNYNELLSIKLNEKLKNVSFNVDYSDSTMEIENLIHLIEKNQNSIQSTIHSSKILIISIGNLDLNQEKIKTIINEYKRLFQLLRHYNNHQIIFISPINFKYQKELKDLASNYNIIYINTNSYISPYIINNTIQEKGKEILVSTILQKIPYIK